MTVLPGFVRSSHQLDTPGEIENASGNRSVLVEANTLEQAMAEVVQAFPRGTPYSGSLSNVMVHGHRLVKGPIGENPTTWEIGLEYSPNAFQSPETPVDDRDAGFRDVSMRRVDLEVKYPVITEVELQVPLGPSPDGIAPAPVATRTGHDIKEQSFIMNAVEYEVRVNVPAKSFSEANFNALLRARGREIHLIGGGFWRFDGGELTRRDIDTYAVRYSWIGEDGNPAFDELNNSTPATGTGSIIPIPARPAFHRYDARPISIPGNPGDPIERSWFIVAYSPYDEGNPLGWQSLPGLAP